MFGTVGIEYLLFLGVLMLRLAGLPPTIGFAMKWAVFLPVCSSQGFYNNGRINFGFFAEGILLQVFSVHCDLFLVIH